MRAARRDAARMSSTPTAPLSELDDPALLRRLCGAARGIALTHFRSRSLDTENKRAIGEGFDPVTIADRAIEQQLRAMLAEARPEDGILGEEFGRRDGPSGRLWVLDPIDGTRAFMSGLLNWGVLIGLHDGDRLILGALDQPYTAERFIGDLTGSAPAALLERGEKIEKLAVRPCADLREATLFTTDPALFAPGPEREAFERVAAQARLVRYGTDCYGYAMVAAGQADLVIEAGLSAYDVAALIPLVEAAGGRFTAWDETPAAWGGTALAAGDPALHAQVSALLTQG